jgi:hypothetical protein
MQNIENLNLVELQELLKDLKSYKQLSNQLWKRGIELFKRNLNWSNLLLVEYFWDKENAINISLNIYKNFFNLDVKKDDIKIIQKKELKWWVKVYKNDSMVDLSFSKIEKLIK